MGLSGLAYAEEGSELAAPEDHTYKLLCRVHRFGRRKAP